MNLEGTRLSSVSDRGRQISPDLTYMRNPQTLNSQEQCSVVVVRRYGVGEMGAVDPGANFPL